MSTKQNAAICTPGHIFCGSQKCSPGHVFPMSLCSHILGLIYTSASNARVCSGADDDAEAHLFKNLSHLYIKAVFRKKQNTSNSTQKNISKKNVSEALLQRNTNCGQKYKCTATRKACAVGYVDH